MVQDTISFVSCSVQHICSLLEAVLNGANLSQYRSLLMFRTNYDDLFHILHDSETAIAIFLFISIIHGFINTGMKAECHV